MPDADRDGLLWPSRGVLTVRNGTLSFERGPEAAGNDPLEPGRYANPFQGVSLILPGPGSRVGHDALRLPARHGTALAAVGDDGARCHAEPPLVPGRSGPARAQARASARRNTRVQMARRMQARRTGDVVPRRDIAVLRGTEGAGMKETYRLIAGRVGVQLRGRVHDRARPAKNALPNQGLNHAASAVEAGAAIAVPATGTIRQPGVIHGDPGQSFVPGIAGLCRDAITMPSASRAARPVTDRPIGNIERVTRRTSGRTLVQKKVIPSMIARRSS